MVSGLMVPLVVMCTLLSTVPAVITPTSETPTVNSDTNVIIDWTTSDSISDDVLEYIVDVRKYTSNGDGEVVMKSIAGYPLQTPDTQLTVESLGELALHHHDVMYGLSPQSLRFPMTTH